MQCYEKHQWWASCLYECTPDMETDSPWTCKQLGSRTAGTPMTTTTLVLTTTSISCSVTRKEDCTHSQCCKDPGMQCYKKHHWWASCQLDCTPGVDPRDPEGHHSPWSCKKLGTRTPGTPIVTTTIETTSLFHENGESVDASGSLIDWNSPESWDSPMDTIDSDDAIQTNSKLIAVGQCAVTRKQDCSKVECCADPGMQCYRKNKYWSTCQLDCVPGIDPRDRVNERTPWSCEKLGTRTPGTPIVTTTEQSSVAEEALLHLLAGSYQQQSAPASAQSEDAGARSSCSRTRKEDCSRTRCCSDPGMQCYEKNEYWAACQEACILGIDHRDSSVERTPWTCRALGSRSPGEPLTTTTSTTRAMRIEDFWPDGGWNKISIRRKFLFQGPIHFSAHHYPTSATMLFISCGVFISLIAACSVQRARHSTRALYTVCSDTTEQQRARLCEDYASEGVGLA